MQRILITTVGILLSCGSSAFAQAKTEMSWATGSPSSPQKGWIQGAGSYLPSDLKKKVANTVVSMKCVDKNGKEFGAQTASGKDGVWTALRISLDPGEYTCEAAIIVIYDDFTFENGKTVTKTITIE